MVAVCVGCTGLELSSALAVPCMSVRARVRVVSTLPPAKQNRGAAV